MIGLIWFFLLRNQQVGYLFYLYMGFLMVLMFFKKGNIVTSGVIVCFSMIQKYLITHGGTGFGMLLQVMLLYIALHREGREKGIEDLKEYPPKTYLFFACLSMYIYFLIQPGSIYYHEYILGVTYTLTVILGT